MVLEVLRKTQSTGGFKRRELNPQVALFFDALDKLKPSREGPFVEVSDMVRKLGKVYERFRTVVDYRDEHMLRKSAIERIIKRRFDQEARVPELAMAIVEELIRAGYIENASLPEELLKGIERILDKYVTIESALESQDPQNSRKHISELRGILAAELEDFFGPEVPISSGVMTLGRLLREHLVFRGKINERERDFQILLACERALRSTDRFSLSYALLRASIKDWDEVKGVRAEQFARNFSNWSSFFAACLDHPLRYKLLRITKRYAVLFTLLFDISKLFQGQMKSLAANIEDMRSRVLDAYLKRYNLSKKRLRRSAVRAVVYLFLTKFLIALVLELPYDLAFFGYIKWVQITINLLFPPVFMALVALFIRMPSKRNTGAIITGMEGLLEFGKAGNLNHEIRTIRRHRGFSGVLSDIFYAITYLITFGVIVWVLRESDFTLLGVLIFLFFLTVVSFFAIRIRRNVRELLLFVEKERGLSTLIDFFTLPIVRAGQWLSESFQRINVFVFILDMFIEAPLQMVLEVLEHFIAFFREKKEEVY